MALSDTHTTHTHFPRSGSHGPVRGMLKSPSCVCRWCITLICRMQAFAVPPPPTSQSAHTPGFAVGQTQRRPALALALSRLALIPATLADPANMWSTWARQTLNPQVWEWGKWKGGGEMEEKYRPNMAQHLL